MRVDDETFISQLFESISIRQFMIKFNYIEKVSKKIFSGSTHKLAKDKISLLYFYLSSLRSNDCRIIYNSMSLTVCETKYLEAENFTYFNFNQIINIQKHNSMVEDFIFNITSINNKYTEYCFVDCCLKLVKMRNKLAHEQMELSFSDNEIIELLPNSILKNSSEKWFSTLDTDLMNDATKAIYSNLIFMDTIISVLDTKVVCI